MFRTKRVMQSLRFAPAICLLGFITITPAKATNFEWSPDGTKLGRLTGSDFRLVDTKSGVTTAIKISSMADDFQWVPGASAVLLKSAKSLTWLDLMSGKRRVLITTHEDVSNSKISPDGRFVSFVSQHNLWLLNVVSGEVNKLTTGGTEEQRKGEWDWVCHEFGLQTGYWWSPDSSSIAFLELDERQVGKIGAVRYPRPGTPNPIFHVFTINLKTGHVVTMDTGADTSVYLPRVSWLPDSKHLAIQRLNRQQTLLQLLIADERDGTSQTILTEPDAYWINIHDDFRFLSDGERFLWSSERSGYRHLYLYDGKGNLLAQITKGNWEVCGIDSVDEAGRAIYFTATEKTPLERHLYRIGFDGSGLKRLTSEAGWHQVRFAPQAVSYIDSYSTAVSAPVSNLMRVDGTRIAALEPSPPVDLFSAPEFLTIRTHDAVSLNAMLIKPLHFDPDTRYPVLVYAQGGPGEQAVRNAWDATVSPWHQTMAQRGFLIFALDNRGSAGRGHLFEEPIHCRFGAQEMSDQRDGIGWLRRLPYVDATRIGIWGSGYGAHLVLHAMFEDPEDFKAGFAQTPIADWSRANAAFAERYLEVPHGFSEEFDASSPIQNAGALRGNLLIAAPEEESVTAPGVAELRGAFKDAGRNFEFIPLSEQPSEMQTLERAAAFFVENLHAAAARAQN